MSVTGTDTGKSTLADAASTDSEIARRTEDLHISSSSSTPHAQTDTDIVMPEPSTSTSSSEGDYLDRAFRGVDLDDEDGSDFNPDAAGSEDSEESSEDDDDIDEEEDEEGLASGDEEVAAKGKPRKTYHGMA